MGSEQETPAEFLERFGCALRNRTEIDAGLANVLATHVLKANPAIDAVAIAKNAILELARERANAPKPGAANG